MRIAPVAFLAVAAASVALGCGRQRTGSVDPQAAAFVEVENQSFFEMTIYIVRGGNRVRLGNVGGNATEIFEIPRTFVNPGLPIRFLADPIGSRVTPTSQELPVWPGDRVRLRIPPGEE
jgi:hypothetical protein